MKMKSKAFPLPELGRPISNATQGGLKKSKK